MLRSFEPGVRVSIASSMSISECIAMSRFSEDSRCLTVPPCDMLLLLCPAWLLDIIAQQPIESQHVFPERPLSAQNRKCLVGPPVASGLKFEFMTRLASVCMQYATFARKYAKFSQKYAIFVPKVCNICPKVGNVWTRKCATFARKYATFAQK